MRISRNDLAEAARQGLLKPAQIEPLWKYLAGRSPLSFRTASTFFGGFLIITAFTVFMVKGWDVYGGKGVLILALVYIAGLTAFSEKLAGKEPLETARGILLAAAVCLVPLAIYGFQEMLGLWQGNRPGQYRDFHIWVRSGWVWMELGTLAAGGLALWRMKFPFLVFPIAFILWYLSMDLTPVIFGPGFSWDNADFAWEKRKLVSIGFGLVVLAAAYAVDWRIRKDDFAFWLYLSGLLAFWGGLSLLDSHSELGKFFYACINLVLIVLGVVLQRRMFLVFGVMGIFGYLTHLAWRVFSDAIAFTIVLSGLGLLLIFLAIQAQRHAAKLEALRKRWMPPALLRLAPPRR
jgi:hypothetical protein